MGANWDSYIERFGYKLEAGDKVEAVKDFWFYADFYEAGQQFEIQPDMVGHAFEDWVKKI